MPMYYCYMQVDMRLKIILKMNPLGTNSLVNSFGCHFAEAYLLCNELGIKFAEDALNLCSLKAHLSMELMEG